MSQSELVTYLCLFHSQRHAEATLAALENAGFQRSSIAAVGESKTAGEVASVREELRDLGAPDRDLDHLQEGIAAGGVVLRLQAPPTEAHRIEGIFARYSAAKIDDLQREREDDTAPALLAEPVLAQTPAPLVEGAVVPVVAEELVVGKREVERGGVRVFGRTVEEPVSEMVSLHEEHVVVERMPINREATAADLRAGDQVIELAETAEVPVVGKVARVVEEVRLGTEGVDHTETIRDTVRHSEVEVESLGDEGRTSLDQGTAAEKPYRP